MRRLRVGILGAGFWALDNHLPILRSRADVEVAGICRLGQKELQAAQHAYSIPFATEDYEKLLALDGLDAVIVASPHHLHFTHSRAALRRGIHVLCEKPMTLAAEEAMALASEAAERHLHFLVAYGWNYTEYASTARRLIQRGAIGDVEHILCHMASSLRDLFSGQPVAWADHALFQPEQNTWSNPATGGGFAHGQLTHALALLFWITGLEPSRAFSFSRTSSTGADLYDAIACTFANGATGMVGGAGTMPSDATYQLDLRIFGSEGMLLLDIERPRLELQRNDGARESIPIRDAPGAYECIAPVQRFLDLVQGLPVENCSDASLGASVVAMLQASMRSASTGMPEDVSLGRPADGRRST